MTRPACRQGKRNDTLYRYVVVLPALPALRSSNGSVVEVLFCFTRKILLTNQVNGKLLTTYFNHGVSAMDLKINLKNLFAAIDKDLQYL